MKPKTPLIFLGVVLLVITLLPKALMVSVNYSNYKNTDGLSSHAPILTASESRRPDRREIERPISTYRVFLPYWRTDRGFYSKIYMRNVNVRRSMVVSVSLVTQNDTTKLSDMKIDPAQTISVDVAEVLLANSKPRSTEGRAFIDFLAESPGAINAYAQIVNEQASIALSFPFQRESSIRGRLEAVAWAYDLNTDVYISIQNTSKNTVKAIPILLVGSHPVRLQEVKLHTMEATTLKLPTIDWSNEEEFPRSFGVTIEQKNDQGGLIAQGWAINPIRGFSTGFSFSPRAACNCGPGRKHNMYGTGVAIGPSAMMRGAVFDPVLILRNVSDENMTITPFFSYMAGEIPQQVKLPGLALAPGESAVRKLYQYQLDGIIPDSVSTGGIHLQYENEKGGLIAEMASVDSTGFYTSQVPLVCGGKNALHMSYWRTDGDWDSILQIENISEHQTVAELTISYPGGLYVTERLLKAGELATISVKQLQQSQAPDSDGKLLPLSATIGGINIWSKDVNQALIINGMIINSVTGTCGFCGGFGAVQFYGLTDMPQNCFGTAFREYEVNETVPVQMYLYFDTSQCGSDSIQHLQVLTPGIFLTSSSTTLLTVGTGFGQFSAETQGFWSGPEDPNCQSPQPLGATDGFEVFAAVDVTWTTPGGVGTNGGGVPLATGTPPQGSLAYVTTTTITATGSPSGGSYSWSTTSNKVTLTNTASATVTVASVSQSETTGDVTIDLVYTHHGKSTPVVHIPFTVQKPTSMGFVSDGPGTAGNCPAGQSGKKRDIVWQVKDQLGNPINFRLPLFDTLTNTTPNTCLVPTEGEGTAPGGGTGQGGQWGHKYRLCSTACNNGGSCSVTGTQKYFVQGFEISLDYTMTCTSITVNGL